eukprot:gene12957-14287_t
MTVFSVLTDGNLVEKIVPAVVAATSGVVAYLVLNAIYSKTRGPGNPDCINKSVEKDKAKVAHSFDIEDLGDKVAFCRCWKSRKFPYCDGSHNVHNKLTGDNVGPVCIGKKKEQELEGVGERDDMAKGTAIDCSCEVCCMENLPIIAADGLFFRCCIKAGTYIPTEMIDQDDLIESLKMQIKRNAARRRGTRSAPASPSKKGHGEKQDFDYNDNILSELHTTKTTTTTITTAHLKRISSDIAAPSTKLSWRERLRSQGPSIIRSSSTPSFNTIPKSILLKCRDRKISDSSLPDVFEEISDEEEKSVRMRKRFTDQLAWVRENGKDFVAMESLKSALEVAALLQVLSENKATTVMQLKVNCNDVITVSYHFLDNFKQEFMMLKVSSGYCMFMAPF